MAPTTVYTLLLFLLATPQPSTSSGVACNKVQPAYPSGAIPKFTGSTGPFGTVCEVKSAADMPVLPEVPAVLDTESGAGGGGLWAVSSRYPDTFMEVLAPAASGPASPRPPTRVSGGNVACGPYHVAKAGATMDEKVWGISGGWKGWMLACQTCGKALEAQIGSGWFCQFNAAPRVAIGVWLKRKVASAPATVTVDATAAGERQTILGFGGAFTDAAAYASSLLPTAVQGLWQELYFGRGGAGYTMGRVPFGGCDFSRIPYR